MEKEMEVFISTTLSPCPTPTEDIKLLVMGK